MSFTLQLGQKAPEFNLISTSYENVCLSSFDSKFLVIFFTCNHCPYVTGSDEVTRQTANKFKDKDVSFIAINSNSANTYQEDSFENMVLRMEEYNFPWVYLHDADQLIRDFRNDKVAPIRIGCQLLSPVPRHVVAARLDHVRLRVPVL